MLNPNSKYVFVQKFLSIIHVHYGRFDVSKNGNKAFIIDKLYQNVTIILLQYFEIKRKLKRILVIVLNCR